MDGKAIWKPRMGEKTYSRPWHDAQAIAHACTATHTNEEKGGLGRWWKACPKVKLRGLILPAPNSK